MLLIGPVEDAARRVVPVGGAQALAGLVQVPVDGVLGEAQFAGDLLGAHVTIDETKAFALMLGEAFQAVGLVRQGVSALIHHREPYANATGRPSAGTLNPGYQRRGRSPSSSVDDTFHRSTPPSEA